MTEPTWLDRYLTYLKAVPESFKALEQVRPVDPPIAGITGVQAVVRTINALVEARRMARQKAGLSVDEVEAAENAIAWTLDHAAEIEAAQTLAQAPFLAR